MPDTYTPSYKENVAGLILEWVEENEIKGALDIAVLASRIEKLKNTRIAVINDRHQDNDTSLILMP